MTQNAGAVGNGRTVLVSGASGFVGRFACDYLTDRGWRVKRLVRRSPDGRDEVGWDPERLWLNEAALEDVHAVLHLAGESVAGRWSDSKKQRISTSRVNGTRTLASAIVKAPRPPRVFVSASAIGFYGERGEEELTEESRPGQDFLAEVCVAWEAESKVVDSVCRRVNPRIGIVFGPNGGALEQMVRPIRWGVGGKLGDGRQWVSWISLLDLVRLFEFAICEEQVQGAINAVAPHAVTNAELTKTIAHLLNRPNWLTVPALALRVALGEFSNEVLASKRVLPEVAKQGGFAWCHTYVTDGVRWSLRDGVNG